MKRPHKTQVITGKKFVWIHNPKTGGTAFSEACVEYGIGERLVVSYYDLPLRPIGSHLTFAETKALMGGRMPELSISFVRNPIDWLQSLHNQFRKNQAVKYFVDFVGIMRRMPSQRDFVEGASEIIRFEDLDLSKLLVRLAWEEKVGLVEPKVNMKNVSNPAMVRLSDEELKELKPFWEPDAEFFGYEMPEL